MRDCLSQHRRNPGAILHRRSDSRDFSSALDAEWAGAIAPDAEVELASCADTATNFGAFQAAQNLLDSASPPPIMSLSFGECETDLGPSGNAFINSMWQQAASEGVSIFISAGDGSAAGCDDFNTATYAANGIAPKWAWLDSLQLRDRRHRFFRYLQ